jgi:aminomuconate-semialdehyde/2-hydroxymuconate-6-semialdehyde dehydrogenase
MDYSMGFQNFIEGTWAQATGSDVFKKYSPFTGELLGEVKQSSLLDLVKAIQSAKKALTNLEKSTHEERAIILENFAKALEENKNEIALQEATHQGLPQAFVLKNSVEASIKILQTHAKQLRTQSANAEHWHRPVGVVGIISSWTLSLKLIVERWAPAFAAGNTVIIQAANHSPITATIIGHLAMNLQLPAGLINILHGGDDITLALAGHPGVRAITAVTTQKKIEAIAVAAIKEQKKLQLTGETKNAGLLIGDAITPEQVEEILASFLIGQGQLPWNISRLFVTESKQEQVIPVIKSYFEKLKPLNSPQENSPWTPMITSEAAEKIAGIVQTAKSEEGKIFCGGSKADHKGNFFQPTVIIDLPNCSVLQQDDVHGPMLIVTTVKYQHEMVKWANTSYLAHSAVIFGPAEKIPKLAEKLDAQHVFANSWLDENTPTILGQKNSFFGNPDTAWDGSFYSDVKKLTGL